MAAAEACAPSVLMFDEFETLFDRKKGGSGINSSIKSSISNTRGEGVLIVQLARRPYCAALGDADHLWWHG